MKRMFGKNKREKAEAMDLDITSLLDVLVILLVFLLKSYNASDLKLNLVKNLSMANSETRDLGQQAIIIQVDTDRNIWIKNKMVTTITGQKENPELLKYLSNEVKVEENEARSPAESKRKLINLVFDKDLDYKYIKSVMHTSALAGYSQFKFIVKGDYN